MIFAAMLAGLASCTKIEPEPPAQTAKKHPGNYQVIIQGGDQWSRFAPLGAWYTKDRDLYSPGRSNAIALPIPASTTLLLGIEATVLNDTLVVEFHGPAGVVYQATLATGIHANAWQPTQINLPNTATSMVLYFTGQEGGYISTINLVKIQ